MTTQNKCCEKCKQMPNSICQFKLCPCHSATQEKKPYNHPDLRCHRCDKQIAACNCPPAPPIYAPTQEGDWEREFEKKFGKEWLGRGYLAKKREDIKSFIHQTIQAEREKGYQAGLKETAIKIDKSSAEWLKSNESVDLLKSVVEAERSRIVGGLAEWINDNIGRSSTAIFLYMSRGIAPHPFDAPSDKWDRNRCVVLLKAMPEWVPRLSEIEALELEGLSNGKPVKPWNEQIPLIRETLNLSNK